jgi:hypothetical protein
MGNYTPKPTQEKDGSKVFTAKLKKYNIQWAIWKMVLHNLHK